MLDVQQCEAVQRLSAIKEQEEAGESPVMRKVFAVLFPFSSAGWNAGVFSGYTESAGLIFLS